MEEKNNYIFLSDAAKGTPYSQEYLSLLARKGKLPAKKIGRNWYTTKEAVESYLRVQQELLLEEVKKRNVVVDLRPTDMVSGDKIHKLEELGIAPQTTYTNLALYVTSQNQSPKSIFGSHLLRSVVTLSATLIIFFSLGTFIMNYSVTGFLNTSFVKSGKDLVTLAAVAEEKVGIREFFGERFSILKDSLNDTKEKIAGAILEKILGIKPIVKKEITPEKEVSKMSSATPPPSAR